jgi:hypothetical protein
MQGDTEINSSSAQINNAEASAKADIKKYDAYTTILKTNGNITTATATAQVQTNNVVGKLGIAKIIENDHNKLKNRDLPDQHSIDSITGLREELNNVGKVKDVLVNGESVVNEEGKADITIPDIPEESDPTVPEHVKKIKEEDIKKWNNGKTYNADDNIVIENDVIKGYTNTGYIVSDTDIKLQPISEVEAMAETTDNKMVYTYDEVVVIYDGTNYIRRSENGIDFDIIELPYNCKNMIYHTVSKRLIAISHNGYFMYSDDNGKTWTAQASSHSTSNTYLFQPNTYSNGFAVINTSIKKIIAFNEDFSVNSTLTTTIVPNYICLLNSSQFIWCNNIGEFKYGAGSKEGIFPSLVGVSVSLLKNVNNKVIVGLNNNNKLYILSKNTVSGSSWVAYNLPKQCTVKDIIYNPNDSTYYILTNINTYYKTTDFVNFVSVDKDSLRGVQGYFTLAGIQATTTDNNKLLLAPTRIKIENMLQKFKRLTDFNKLLGAGLEKKSEETIGVKVRSPIYVSTSGVSLSGRSIDYNYLTEEIEKILKVAEAPITLLSPTEIEDYVWSNWDGTDNFAFKFMFAEAGTFYNVMSYEEEYTVEKYELGYIYIVNNGMSAPYTSVGKFSAFFQ